MNQSSFFFGTRRRYACWVQKVFFCVVFVFILGGGMGEWGKAQELSSFDSIAGYGTEINVKNGASGERKKIILKTPHNTLYNHFLTLDESGKGRVVIPGDETTIAGIYSFVSVAEDEFYSDGISSSFEIFADDPSSQKSRVFATDTTLKTGMKGKISILLLDRYSNPIPSHRITLLSSRSEDRITPASLKTDHTGKMEFWIQSNTSGESVLSAYNETMNLPLLERPVVQFYTYFGSNGLSADSTSTSFSATIMSDESFEEFSKISKFELEFPNTVIADSDENYLTVRALDSDGNVVKDFVGTIKIIIPTDDNALVPGDEGVYTFLEKDQGEMTFSRSVVFPEAGTHALEVYAYDKGIDEINYNIFGKKEVLVEEKSQSSGGVSSSSKPQITTPENGAEFSSPQVALKGTALKNSDVKIVVDDIPVMEVEVDENGEFEAVLKNINPGNHEITVYQKEDPKLVSSPTEFLIDKEISGNQTVILTPEQTTPEGKVDLSVITDAGEDDDIESIIAKIDGKEYTLDHVGTNTYQKTFTAPKESGKYPIVITLTDSLKNTKTLPDELLTVLKEKETPLKKDDIVLSGIYNQKTKQVELSWTPLSSAPLLYIIHSGITENDINKIKSVSGKKKEESVSDLSEGTYFFAVSSVDTTGKDGDLSNIVSIEVLFPTPTPTPKTPTPIPKTPTPTPKTPTPIPKTPTPIPSTPIPIPDPDLFVQGKEISLLTLWDELTKNPALLAQWNETPNTIQYHLSYGLKSGYYENSIPLDGNTTKFVIQDLIPGVQYFVRVQAFGGNGDLLFSYPEKTGVPLDQKFHSSPSVPSQPYPEWVSQTGPQFFYFLAGIFFVLSGWYLSRRER